MHLTKRTRGDTSEAPARWPSGAPPQSWTADLGVGGSRRWRCWRAEASPPSPRTAAAVASRGERGCGSERGPPRRRLRRRWRRRRRGGEVRGGGGEVNGGRGGGGGVVWGFCFFFLFFCFGLFVVFVHLFLLVLHELGPWFPCLHSLSLSCNFVWFMCHDVALAPHH